MHQQPLLASYSLSPTAVMSEGAEFLPQMLTVNTDNYNYQQQLQPDTVLSPTRNDGNMTLHQPIDSPMLELAEVSEVISKKTRGKNVKSPIVDTTLGIKKSRQIADYAPSVHQQAGID